MTSDRKNKLKEAKAKYDQAVYAFILKHSPKAGDIECHVTIPKIVLEYCLTPHDGYAVRAVRSVDNSLKRLRAKGRIWFCKQGHPCWKVCEEVK